MRRVDSDCFCVRCGVGRDEIRHLKLPSRAVGYRRDGAGDCNAVVASDVKRPVGVGCSALSATRIEDLHGDGMSRNRDTYGDQGRYDDCESPFNG